MKTTLISITLLLFTTNISMAWDRTLYDTVETKWSNGNQKEFITRYWHTGNEKGFRPHGQYSTWYENGHQNEDNYYNCNAGIGTWVKWSENGGRIEEAAMFEGKRHGMYIQWHSDRSIKTLGYYKYGQKHGLWTYRLSGDDGNNPNLHTDSIQLYYGDKLAVKLERQRGEEIHEGKTFFNDELDIWIEWGKHNSIAWMRNYTWFELGQKIDGKRNGKWIKLDQHGMILEINYFKEGEQILLE